MNTDSDPEPAETKPEQLPPFEPSEWWRANEMSLTDLKEYQLSEDQS